MEKDQFSSADRKYLPMLSWVDINNSPLKPDQTLALWENFDRLPETKKNILTSERMFEKMHFLEESFRLSEEEMSFLGAIIRDFFLSERKVEWLNEAVTPAINSDKATKVIATLKEHILTIQPESPKASSPEEENKPKAEQLPLLDAMGKYPKIGEQIISNDRIVVKGESAPVRGSVRNWLRAYRDVLGVRKHSAMERGQFLFQSDNTRRLPKEERFRLSALLKSLDENAPLDILIDRQEIQFPDSEEIPAPMQSEAAPAPQKPPIQTPQAPVPTGPFQPVGNRLRIRSAQPAINTQNQTPENTEFEADSEESKGLSSAVYGNLSETPDQSLGRASEEKTGLHFSSSHILPHEQASALGTHRYKESIPPKNTAQSTPTSNTAIGTSTFSGEGGITENQKEATNNNTPKQTGMPQKNFGNLVNLRDKK